MCAVLQLVGSQRVTESPGLEVNLKISKRNRQPPASQRCATAPGATRRPRASAWRRHLGAFHVAQASFAVLLCHPPARCSEVRAPGRCPWGIHGACGVLGWGEEVWGAESRRPSGSEQLSCTTGSPGTESASYPVLLTPSCKANSGTQGNPRAALGASGLRCLRAVPAIQSGSESALEHRI